MVDPAVLRLVEVMGPRHRPSAFALVMPSGPAEEPPGRSYQGWRALLTCLGLAQTPGVDNHPSHARCIRRGPLMSDPITSSANPRVKSLVRLRRRRARDASGTFLIEGFRELTRAVAGGIQIEALYTCPSLYVGSNEAELTARIADSGAKVVELAETPFRKASYRDRPEGLIAVARQFDTAIDGLSLEGNPLILVAESIEKPGNLGTMLRTAEAAAVAGVIVADPSTDPFNPNVVRASLGALFVVPLFVTNTTAAIDNLRAGGLAIVATTPDGDLAHYEADLRGPTAVVVGSEQYGLSDRWIEAADERTAIPMPGSVDSLNAAMAAGIVLFEALRQRS